MFAAPSRPHLALALLAVGLLLVVRGWQPQTAVNPLQVQFSQPSGAYERDLLLRLEAGSPEAVILYTTNGRLPTPDTGTLYTTPFYLTAEPATFLTLQARALLPDGTLGKVTTAVYAVGLKATIPIVSLTLEPDALWAEASGLFAHPEERGAAWERSLTLTYFDENGRLAFQLPAGVRIHGLTSRLYEKKSLRLYFRQEYGQARLDYPLFPQSDVVTFKRLVLHGGGQDYPAQRANGTLLRNALMARLAAQTNALAPHSRPVLLFINGERWGIYNVRERVDGDYLHDHFGIEPDAGDAAHWENLTQFVESHDLASPANYAYVQTQIDLANFIDYNLLQMATANTDWPNNNQTRFRDHGVDGRWRWLFWDTDFAFGLAPNSRLDTNMVERLFAPERAERMGGARLLQKLMANPDFAARFQQRAAALLAGPLAPEAATAELDRLVAELAPNIHHETERWPGSSDWAASVVELRRFVQERPFIFQQQLEALAPPE